MKNSNAFFYVILLLLCLFSTVSIANEPTTIPWPVGSTEAMMNSTKTLMNSYGDPQNNWYSGSFHGGLDFDAWTEPPLGTTLVRCVHGANEPDPPSVIITYLNDPSFTDGSLQYVVVTTAGTDSTNFDEYGWCYEHLVNPAWTTTPDGDGWQKWEQIGEGDLISCMHEEPDTRHTHFKWADWGFSNWCYVNPLDYLTPAPTDTNFTWTFNPSGYTPAFEYFFLKDTLPLLGWPNDPADVQAITLDQNNLSGDVDVFFGFGLSGVGQTTTPECGRNDLTAERIEWNIQRSTMSGLQLLVNKYLVNFNCPLNNEENEKVWQLYFKWDMDELRSMFTYIPSGLDHEGLVVCLSNCGDMQGWEGLGIDTHG